jgi:hypothetical protein
LGALVPMRRIELGATEAQRVVEIQNTVNSSTTRHVCNCRDFEPFQWG